MKVAKRLNKALIVVLLLAFALCMAATFLCFNANAIAYAADLSAEDLCELYTDSDNLYESEYTITDYTTLHSNLSIPTYNTSQKWYEMNFTNTPIVKNIIIILKIRCLPTSKFAACWAQKQFRSAASWVMALIAK